MSLEPVVRVTAWALLLLAATAWLLEVVGEPPLVVCESGPCPQPGKDPRGVASFGVLLALGAVALPVILTGRFPRLHAWLVGVLGLGFVALSLPRFASIIDRVRDDPQIAFVTRTEAIGPLDHTAILLGLGLIGCALLMLWSGRRTGPVPARAPTPAVAGAGCAVAGLILGLTPLLPEIVFTGPLLVDQVYWTGGMPADAPVSIPVGARNAAIVLVVLSIPMIAVVRCWLAAGRVAGRFAAVGLAVLATVLQLCCLIVRDRLTNESAGAFDLYPNAPFVTTAANGMLLLIPLMGVCTVLIGLWPRRGRRRSANTV